MNEPHAMNENQMNCSELFHWVTMLGFCAEDMKLYLDTHPHDQDALDYYNQCIELYMSAKKMYEKKYGALTCNNNFHNNWTWNDGPMPWEGGK